MESKPMKILLIEDDIDDCNNFIKCVKERDDIELVAVTGSDIEGLKHVKLKRPEGIILDLELNNSNSGNAEALEFMASLKKLNLNYEPIVIVTTHVNSKRTYDILHRNGVDLILYKDHPQYSCNHVLNKFISFRRAPITLSKPTIEEELIENENKISDLINEELDLIGIPVKMKGRKLLYDAILFLIENEDNDIPVFQHLIKKYKTAQTTINNNMQNAINHAWKASAVEDLTKYYKARINYQVGVPTTMEFVYYYADKIKKRI